MHDTGNFSPYNRSNNNYAKDNRKNSTPMEGLTWNTILKGKRLGYKFTRQKPLGSYIADFYCAKLKLVIEIDGSSHDHTRDYDQHRTRYLRSLDIKVIRYSNSDVDNHLNEVDQHIQAEIKVRKKELGL